MILVIKNYVDFLYDVYVIVSKDFFTGGRYTKVTIKKHLRKEGAQEEYKTTDPRLGRDMMPAKDNQPKTIYQRQRAMGQISMCSLTHVCAE